MLGLLENSLIPYTRPAQPLIIQILNQVNKGCSLYYRYLRKNRNLRTNLSVRENRWQTELNSTFDVNFWNKVYINTASIKGENKLKWLQFQINRNSLYTNYKVNKFARHVQPYCTFCSQEGSQARHIELISHLFFSCNYVQCFWQDVRAWFLAINPPVDIPLNLKDILFGFINENSNTVRNFVILCGKYYIWVTKLKSGLVNLLSFKLFLKHKLDEVKNALLYQDKISLFENWTHVYDLL